MYNFGNLDSEKSEISVSNVGTHFKSKVIIKNRKPLHFELQRGLITLQDKMLVVVKKEIERPMKELVKRSEAKRDF